MVTYSERVMQLASLGFYKQIWNCRIDDAKTTTC